LEPVSSPFAFHEPVRNQGCGMSTSSTIESISRHEGMSERLTVSSSSVWLKEVSSFVAPLVPEG